ncbi:hypothetical protein HT136_20680 [Novosphingobium profundi]|uniref:hypothetical protein n=1 Tax=Novosphingobium profundi TaxID=1774954 RepID=UPI001BDAB9C7|nr:hypothetical protein [Novosphingobium profundi]MBT0670786.1 hypothetical protein [Novosphingobium profundi]
MEVSAAIACADETDNWSISSLPSVERSIHSPARAGVTYFAGAAILAATSMLTPAVHAADKEQPAYAISDDGYFQDERALLIDELRQYERLENGWDGADDDIAPSREAIDEAIHFVESLPPFVDLPEPMVSSDGQVGFFWHDANIYLDIGFRGQGECTFFGKSGNLKIKGKEAVNEAEPVPACVLRFLAQVDHFDEVLV